MPAIGKTGIKRYSKKNTKKSSFVDGKQSDSKGWFKWERTGTRHGKKKVYTTLFKTRQPGIEAANTRPAKLSFKETQDKARGGGSDKFTFKGKSYLTKKPSEVEKKSLRERLTGYKTQAGYDEAKAKRIKDKRIAKIEKRKEEGKSYSAKNLAELKGSEPKKTWITKKTKPTVKKPA